MAAAIGEARGGPAKGAHPKGPAGVAPKSGPRAFPSEGLAHSNQDKRPDPAAEWGPPRSWGPRRGVGPIVDFFGTFGDTGRV
jgi:hypothetical protein